MGTCIHFSFQHLNPITCPLWRLGACYLSLCEFMCASVLMVQMALFPWVLHPLWLLHSLCLVFHGLLWALRGGIGRGYPVLYWVFQRLSLSAWCLTVGLCVCSHLPRWEGSLVMAEQDTDHILGLITARLPTHFQRVMSLLPHSLREQSIMMRNLWREECEEVGPISSCNSSAQEAERKVAANLRSH